MIELLTRLDVVLWNVFFFVPPSREQAEDLLTADEHEQIFAKLYAASRVVHFQIKTTEGQHYQRYLLQQRARESRGRMTETDVITCAPKGVNDGKGFVFINHQGEVYPSRFLPALRGQRDHPAAGRGLLRFAAVCFAARQFQTERQVWTLSRPQRLRRIARPRVCHDRRPVRRGPLLRLRTVRGETTVDLPSVRHPLTSPASSLPTEQRQRKTKNWSPFSFWEQPLMAAPNL